MKDETNSSFLFRFSCLNTCPFLILETCFLSLDRGRREQETLPGEGTGKGAEEIKDLLCGIKI